MLSPFERLVALRYLRARRQEGFISVIAGFSLVGILLGVATLIIVMAVMNGFRHDLLSRVVGVTGHVTVRGLSDDGRWSSIGDFQPLVDTIAAQPHVVQASPLIEGQIMASAGGYSSGAVVRGLRAEDFAARPLLADNMVVGSLEAFAEGRGVIVGSRLASRLRAILGDEITFISPEGNVTAFGTMPRMKAYPIVGIFEVGMYEYDSSYIYMPMEEAQRFFRYGDHVSMIEVMLEDPDLGRDVAREIERAAGRPVSALEWQRVNASFFSALQVERNVMFLILTLIILVAAFNIISSQIMLVQDKGRGIAILRTMGATQGMVLRIFFATGATVGVLGTAVGAILGIAFAANIDRIRIWIEQTFDTTLWPPEVRFLTHMPSRIESSETVAVVVMALVLTFLASIYPAWKAARLDPVEVLRYE